MAAGQNWGVSFRINAGAMASLSTHTTNIKNAATALDGFARSANSSLKELNTNLGGLVTNLRNAAADVDKIAKNAGKIGSVGSVGGGFNRANPYVRPEDKGHIDQALARYLGAPQNEFSKIYGKQTPTLGRGGSIDQNQLLATMLYARVTNPILGKLDTLIGKIDGGGPSTRSAPSPTPTQPIGGGTTPAKQNRDTQAIVDAATKNIDATKLDLNAYTQKIKELEMAVKKAVPKRGEPSSEQIAQARELTQELQKFRELNRDLEAQRRAASVAAQEAKAKAAPKAGLDDSPVTVSRKNRVSQQQYERYGDRMEGTMVGGGGARTTSMGFTKAQEDAVTVQAARVLQLAMKASPDVIKPLGNLQPPASMIQRSVAENITRLMPQIAQINEFRGGSRQRDDAYRTVIKDEGFMRAMSTALGFKGDFASLIRNKPGTNEPDKAQSQWQRLMTAFQMVVGRLPDKSQSMQTANERDAARSPRKKRRDEEDETLASIDPNAARRPVARRATRFGIFSSGSITEEDQGWLKENQKNWNVHNPVFSSRNEVASPQGWGGAFSRVVNWGTAATFAYGGTQQLVQGIKLLSQYERALMDVRRVASPLGFDIQKISKSAQSMGQEFGQSILETSKAMTIFAQQGMDMQGIIDSTRAAMLLTNTTELDLVESTEALTAAQRQFQISTAQSMRIVDAWTEVANTTAVGANTLADAMRIAGTSMRTAGVDFDRANGIIAAVGEATRKSGEEIGTAMKFIFQHVREDQAVQSLQQIGIFTEDANGKMRSAVSIVDELHGRWGTLTDAQRQQIAVAIAGTRHLNDFFVLMEGWNRQGDITISSMTSQGSAMKQNSMLMETLEKQVGQLKAAYEGLWVAVGNSGVLANLKQVVQVMTTLLDSFGKVNDFTQGGAGLAFGGAVAYKGLQFGGQLLGGSIIPALTEKSYTPTTEGRRQIMGKTSRLGKGFIDESLSMLTAGDIAGIRAEEERYDRDTGMRRPANWGSRAGGLAAIIAGGVLQQGYQNYAGNEPGSAPTATGTGVNVAASLAQGLGAVALLKRPGGFADQKGNLAVLIPIIAATILQVGSSIKGLYDARSGNSTASTKEGIDAVKATQERLSTTRASIQEQLRRARNGQDMDPDVIRRLRDEMSLFAPEVLKSANSTESMIKTLDSWSSGIDGVNNSLRKQRNDLIEIEAVKTEASSEFKDARKRIDEADKKIASAAAKGKAGYEEGAIAISNKGEAENVLSKAFNVRLGQALAQGQVGTGLDLSRDRLKSLGETYKRDPEEVGRDLLKRYLEGMGAGQVDLSRQLGNRSVSDVQFYQNSKNGPVFNLRTNERANAAEYQNQLVVRTQDAIMGDAIARIKSGNLSKLMEEFERAVELLIQKNQRLIENMEAGNRAIAGRAFGQNVSGSSLGLQMISREGQTLANIERNGIRGIRPLSGGTANSINTDLVRMTGELINGGMNAPSLSMQGLLDIMGQSEDFQRTALRDVQGRAGALLQRGGAILSPTASQEDFNAVPVIGQTDTRALIKALDENTVSKLNELAGQRSQAVQANDSSRVQAIDQQANDLVAGSLRTRGRRLRDETGEYIRNRTEGNADFATRALQQLGQGFRLGRLNNPGLTADQFAQSPEARDIQNTLKTLADETRSALELQQKRVAETTPGSTERTNAESLAGLLGENVRTLDDATKNYAQHINDAVQGMVDMGQAMDRISSLAGSGSAFGQTGTAGAAFSSQVFTQFAQKYLQMAQQATTEERRLMLTDMARQLQQRGESSGLQVGLARELQKQLIQGLPSQYLANRAVNAVGLNAPMTGAELKASLTDSIQSSLQVLAMRFAEGRTGSSAEMGNQFLESIRPQLTKLNEVVQDLQLNTSPEYMKNYLLASPSDQAMADYVRQQIDGGASASEIFADPNMRAAARDNPLLGQLADLAVQRDISERLLNITDDQNDKVGSIESAVRGILDVVNNDRSGRGLAPVSREALPFAMGTMDGGRGVDSRGRIAQDGTPAILHEGEVVLTKRQASALFDNKFAKGTGAGSASFAHHWEQLNRSGNLIELFNPQNSALADTLKSSLISDITSKGMIGVSGTQWRELLDNISVRIAPLPVANKMGQTSFPSPMTVGGNVSLVGNDPGIVLSKVFGNSPTEVESAFRSLFAHEGTHGLDLPLGPNVANLGSKNLQNLQGRVLSQMMQHVVDDTSPMGQAARSKLVKLYSKYFDGGGSVGRNKATFALVSEARAAMNQLAAGGAELSPIWKQANQILAQGTNSLYSAAKGGAKTRAFNQSLEVTLGQLHDLFGGQGAATPVANMTSGQLYQHIISKMSPAEYEAAMNAGSGAIKVAGTAGSRIGDLMKNVTNQILSKPRFAKAALGRAVEQWASRMFGGSADLPIGPAQMTAQNFFATQKLPTPLLPPPPGTVMGPMTQAEALMARLNPRGMGRPTVVSAPGGITNPNMVVEAMRARGTPSSAFVDPLQSLPDSVVNAPVTRSPYVVPMSSAATAAREYGWLARGVGQVEGFKLPRISSLRSLSAGNLLRAGVRPATLAGAAGATATIYGQSIADHYGYGGQWNSYGQPVVGGLNSVFIQQSLARTGSISGMQLLPRAFATVGMQGTARSLIGGSRMVGGGIAGRALVVADLTTRAGELIGNATGNEDLSKASRATRNLITAPITAPLGMAQRYIANTANLLSGNGFTSDMQREADKDTLGRAGLANNSDSWWNARGVTAVTGYIDEDMANLVTAMAESQIGLQGQLDDSAVRALLQQPLAYMAGSAWNQVTKQSTPTGDQTGSILDGLPPEVRRAVAGISPNNPNFAVHVRAAQLSYEGGRLMEVQKQYENYIKTNPTGVPDSQETLQKIANEIAVKKMQWQEVMALNSGYRSSGLFDLDEVKRFVELQRDSIGDVNSPIIASQAREGGWAKVYAIMQGLNEGDAQSLMTSGAFHGLTELKRTLGFNADIRPWVNVAAGMPRTSTLVDLLSAASGKQFSSTQDALVWLQANKEAFGAGSNINAALSKNAETKKLMEMVQSGQGMEAVARASLEANTGNAFDKVLNDFKTTKLFEQYEGNYNAFIQDADWLLPKLQYDFQKSGPDVEMLKQRLTLANTMLGPINDKYGVAKGQYAQIMSFPRTLQELLGANPALRARVGGDANSLVDWFGLAGRPVPNDMSRPTQALNHIHEWIARAQQDMSSFAQINQNNADQSQRDEKLSRDRKPATLRLRSVRVLDAKGNPIVDENGRMLYQTEAKAPDGSWMGANDSAKVIESVSGERQKYAQTERQKNILLARMRTVSNRPVASVESLLNSITDPILREQISNYEVARMNMKDVRGFDPQSEVARQGYRRQMDEIAIQSGFGRDFFEKAADAFDKTLERETTQASERVKRGYATGTYAQRGSRLIDNDGYVSKDHVATVHAGERVYPQDVSEGIDHLMELMKGLGNGPIQQAVRPADTMTSDASKFMGYSPSDGPQRHVHEGTVTVAFDSTAIDYTALADAIVKKLNENSGGANLTMGDTIPQWYERGKR